jgi:3-hydroxybutyryl-CoA dehydrogenase
MSPWTECEENVMDRTTRIGIVGAGTMGSGIAQGAAASGFTVILHDREPAALARAVAQIRDSLARAVEKGRLSAADAEAAAARVLTADKVAGLASCGLVIEAIIESAAAKEALFADLSSVLAADALIATNTSSLKVDDLARSVRHPERFLGLHYFFPAAVNALLEIVRGAATSAAAMAAASRFAEATGKQPIRCRDSFGFAVNRFFVPYLNEAVRLVDEGFTPGEVDAAVCAAFATPAGPFKVMDMSKPAIALHACRTLMQLGPFYHPAPGLVTIGEAGGLWNAIPPAELPAAAAAAIAERIQGAVLTAVLQALEEGVAEPADFDLGARVGLKWGWQPCAAARQMGRGEVERLVGRCVETIPTSVGQVT